MIKCKFCEKEFKNRRVFSLHLTKTESDKFENALDRERILVDTLFGKETVDTLIDLYKEEKISADELYRSTDIVKLLVLMGIKRTNSEEKKTKRYREKYTATLSQKYGVGITNPSQIEFVKNKKAETAKQNHGSYQKYLETHRDYMRVGYKKYINDIKRKQQAFSKIEQTCKARYNHKNFGAGIQAKEKRVRSLKETIASWDYEERLRRTSAAREAVSHRGGYSSKPEKRVRHALTELGIEFRTNVHIWDFNYDMVFGKFIIEVQGDMWHANPKMYKSTDLIMGKLLASDLWKKDARKRSKAESNGYALIPIWECDIINKSDEQLVEMVSNKLKENGYVFD